MIYRDVLIMKDNLEKVNFIEGADPKFVYAVAKNKEKCEQIIKSMEKMITASDALNEYREAAGKINQEYAEKDTDGTVGYVIHQNGGRGYRKIVGEGNKDSPYEKKMADLKKKYQAAIDEHAAKIKIYEKHLLTEVSGDDCRWRMIDLEVIPAGLHPAGMSGCVMFIRDEEKVKSPGTGKKKK